MKDENITIYGRIFPLLCFESKIETISLVK